MRSRPSRHRRWPLLIGALAALATAACGSSSGSTGPGTAQLSSAVNALSPSQLVLQPGDAPAATAYLKSQSRAETVDNLVQGDKDAAAEKRLLLGAGFQTAYRSIFAGLHLSAPAQRNHVVSTYAIVFPSASAATAAIPLFVSSAQGSVTKPAPGLGSDAVSLRTRLTTIPGSSYFYAWRSGNAVLAMIDAGASQVVGQGSSLALARSMAAAAARKNPSGHFSANDASRLVLSPAAAPADTNLISSRSRARTLRELAPSSRQAARLTELGFKAGYTNEFLSAGLQHPASKSPSQTGDLISSEAQKYASPDKATRAYQLFLKRQIRLFKSRSITRLPTPSFGPNAYGFGYVDHRATGNVTGYGYFWQRGDFVLALFDIGTSSSPTAQRIEQLADRMNARLPG